jgi:hypothetical protein
LVYGSDLASDANRGNSRFASDGESSMAKGQMRSNKEKRKPKKSADDKKKK